MPLVQVRPERCVAVRVRVRPHRDPALHLVQHFGDVPPLSPDLAVVAVRIDADALHFGLHDLLPLTGIGVQREPGGLVGHLPVVDRDHGKLCRETGVARGQYRRRPQSRRRRSGADPRSALGPVVDLVAVLVQEHDLRRLPGIVPYPRRGTVGVEIHAADATAGRARESRRLPVGEGHCLLPHEKDPRLVDTTSHAAPPCGQTRKVSAASSRSAPGASANACVGSGPVGPCMSASRMAVSAASSASPAATSAVVAARCASSSVVAAWACGRAPSRPSLRPPSRLSPRCRRPQPGCRRPPHPAPRSPRRSTHRARPARAPRRTPGPGPRSE